MLEANVATGPAKLFSAFVDNRANTVGSYVKLYNATTATVGTTVPPLVLWVPASIAMTFNFLSGLMFSTAISFAAVTTGGTSGTTCPVSDVIVELVVR